MPPGQRGCRATCSELVVEGALPGVKGRAGFEAAHLEGLPVGEAPADLADRLGGQGVGVEHQARGGTGPVAEAHFAEGHSSVHREVEPILFADFAPLDQLLQQAVAEPLPGVVVPNGFAYIGVANATWVAIQEVNDVPLKGVGVDERLWEGDGLGHGESCW